MLVVTPRQMQALEKKYMSDTSISAYTLMGRAAQGLLTALSGTLARFPAGGARVLLFIGPGANGGDGWALACLLKKRGARPVCVYAALPQEGSAADLYHKEYLALRGTAVKLTSGTPDCESGKYVLQAIRDALHLRGLAADSAVDCMFGTGLSRPLTGIYLGCCRAMQSLKADGCAIVAADIPSGLDGETGECSECCPADMTVTFAFAKYGQLFRRGQDVCGKLTVHDIGIPDTYAPEDSAEWIRALPLPPRKSDTHKGSYGHLLILAGSKRYTGAAILCTGAALRSGAGLVTSGCVSALRPLLQQAHPAAMAWELTSSDAFDAEAASGLDKLLLGKTALAVGPGLTRDASPEFLRKLLASDLPAVIDADALNLLAEHSELRALLTSRHILTPHPGEFARLYGAPVTQPVTDAKALARKLGCVVLLKGNVTVVTDSVKACLLTPGNPGMACGGSGDVLTGLIGGILAQGFSPMEAAKSGALLHGEMGRMAREKFGENCMNAEDLCCLESSRNF